MARRALSRSEKESVLTRQTLEGETVPRCAECAKPMSGASAIEFDHRRLGLPRWYFANDPSCDPDDPEDIEATHAHCHRKRTAKDLGTIAKTKRQRGETGQSARRRLASGRKIPGHSNPWGYR